MKIKIVSLSDALDTYVPVWRVGLVVSVIGVVSKFPKGEKDAEAQEPR
jgi:hypothetical protein